MASFRLDELSLRKHLLKAPLEFRNNGITVPLDVPLPDGQIETFNLVESPVLSPAAAALHPEIKTYTGNGTKNKRAVITISLTSSGFNAIILNLEGVEAVYVEKFEDDVYGSYFSRDVKAPTGKNLINIPEGVPPLPKQGVRRSPTKLNTNARLAASSGTTIRTFRLSMAATGEFTANHGGTVAGGYNALVGYVTRMNAFYINELSIRFQLVSTNSFVFTNALTDPFTNDDDDKLFIEGKKLVDDKLGLANYDVAFVMAANGAGVSASGVAYFSSLCDDELKAGSVAKEGDISLYAQYYFDKTLFHEMGHKLSMSHSYNSTIPVCTTREAATSVEPGSGATIMSYGFKCDSDDYFDSNTDGLILNFHSVSYNQAVTYLSTLVGGTSVSTGNTPPVITMPSARTIPKSTPFFLTGSATDVNGDALTYSWEGTNIGTSEPTKTTFQNTAAAPFFRSYAPVTTGTRLYPQIDRILDGSNYGSNRGLGDKLPSVGVITTHSLTVRDNRAGGGGVTNASVAVTVDGNSGPFLETTNLTGSYLQGTSKTITWSVNNTNAAPVSCTSINILLSTDGGLTFPTVLAANTPNDGSQSITLPNVDTDKARIKIESVNNIFFDISNRNFSIVNPANQKPLVVTLTTSKTAVSVAGPVVLTAAVTGGRAEYTYSFEGDLGYTDSQSGNTETLTALQTGVHTFTVTVTDNSFPTSQTATATVSFTAQSVPLVGLTAPDSIARSGSNSGQVPRDGRVFKGSGAAGTVADGGDRDYAIFHFARSNADEPLTVRYSIGGSAIGNSILTFADNVTFEEDELEFDLYVYPGDDLLINGDQTLTLTLIDDADYDVLPQDDDATIYIKGNDDALVFSIDGVTTINCTPVNNRVNLSFTPQYGSLDGSPVSFSVVNELAATTNAGPYTLSLYPDNPTITLVAVQNGVASSFPYNWLAACNSLTATPGNTAPTVANTIPAQSATVGQAFSYVIPANTFADDQTPNSLALSVSGLPAGLSYSASTATISGTPSASGVSTVTVTATDPGSLTVSTSFTLTVSPAGSVTGTAPFSITGVTTISCTPVANRINLSFSPQYAGLNGQPITFSVANELVPTTQPGPYSLSLYADNPVITLRAVQNGTTSTFSYGWLAACNSNTPPPVNQAPVVANSIPAQNATVGQAFSYVIPTNTFSDPNNDVLTVLVSGLPAGLNFMAPATISGTPSASGVSTVTVTATDPGSLSVSTTFTITVSPAGSVTTAAPFSITGVTTVSCTTVSAGQRTLSFTPRYAGLNGSVVSFSVVSELLPTTASGPYTLTLYTDNPVITLKAVQSGLSTSFAYNWLAVCNGAVAGRLGYDAPGLSVRVLGNPVQNGQVLVEVQGVRGESLQMSLRDMQGRLLDSHTIEQAGSLERHTFEINRQQVGVFILLVNTATQSQTVKVLKAD